MKFLLMLSNFLCSSENLMQYWRINKYKMQIYFVYQTIKLTHLFLYVLYFEEVYYIEILRRPFTNYFCFHEHLSNA